MFPEQSLDNYLCRLSYLHVGIVYRTSEGVLTQNFVDLLKWGALNRARA